MPNLPWTARIDRLDAEIAYLETELAQGRARPGMRGRLRQLRHREAWYHTYRKSDRAQKLGAFYRFAQGKASRAAPTTPPDLVLDVRDIVPT